VWWYNHEARFFTDRWFFVYPQFANVGVGAAMLAEASAIAAHARMDIVINGKLKRRASHLGRGVHFSSPKVVHEDIQPKKGTPLH
jgi:hypothetical protein